MRALRGITGFPFVLSLYAAITTTGTFAQCANNNVLTGTAITPTCPGTVTVPCVQGGQYVLVNVTIGNIYTFATCTGSSFDTEITLFNNAGGVSLGYNDDACGLQSSVVWTGTFNGQLRVLVDRYPCASNTICIPVTINCAAPPPPVTNNEPCQPLNLSVSSTCSPQTFSNIGANLTIAPAIPAPGCGNLVAGSADVWFTFTAPPSGIAIIESQAGTLTDGAMALYTATACAGTYNLVLCSDDDNGAMPFLAFDNLVPGQIYYLRYWGYGTATGTFTLCVHGPTSLPAGNCVYELQMFDAFGDGWGGSTVTVIINGTPVATYTCNTLYNVFLIGVNIGQVLTLQYSAIGPFEGDNDYRLSFLSTSQTVFNSGTPPTPGLAFTQTITCQPPSPTAEDCGGSITLCSDQAISNTTNNTGTVQDLNASNFGCLLGAEQQGTWYNFTVAANGTLGMNIVPTGPDDYDWAIWGPYPPGSQLGAICPPLGTPIRCSFASGLESVLVTGSFITGMGISNVAWASPQYAPPLPAISDPNGGGDGWTPGITVTTGQVFLLYVSNFDNTGQAFTMDWVVGGGASLNCTVLPAELIDLKAFPLGSSVLVEWRTASEHNTDLFEVQRSSDGHTFDVVGTLPAAQNSTSLREYRLMDVEPLNGMSYYRLRIVDQDGAYAWSDVEVVDRSMSVSANAPFPNPVENGAWWALPSPMVTDVRIVDGLGRVVLQGIPFDRDQGVVRLPTQGLTSGAYSVVALGPDGCVISTARFLQR